MENKDNEIFNGIIDVPNDTQNNPQGFIAPSFESPMTGFEVGNSPLENSNAQIQQPEMSYNYNFNMQEPLQPEQNNMPNMTTSFTTPSFESPMTGFEVGNSPLENSNTQIQQPGMSYNYNFNMQEPLQPEQNNMPELINEQGKSVDYQLLRNLSNDTNNLINPTMLVSPIGKQTQGQIEIEEPKVDYEEIKIKKKVALIVIVSLVILITILLFPTIYSML